MSTTPMEGKRPIAKQYKTIASSAANPVITPSTPSQKSVPPFLNKLYSMVDDPESNDLICWSEDGSSFFVNRQEDFARTVLPRFFKHKKFSSFVRQLNMYGFHKVPHLQQGVLETDSESERWEFSNPHFKRNQRDLLLLVSRKKGANVDEKEISTVDLHHILEEIQSIKKHQMEISSQLQSIQRDNQVLWRETVSARERHQRHQETIDKILRFLASVFSNGEKRPAISRKRRFLLGPAGDADHDEEGSDEEVHIKEEETPSKKQRQHSPDASTFNIDDVVGKNDLGLSTALPEHIKDSAKTNTSSDLDDAIALNDQAKHDESTLAAINDYSQLANIPQLQNLQSIITLAQSNPELLTQLTNEAFYGNPAGPANSFNSPPIYNTILPAPSTNPPSTASTVPSTPIQSRSINQVTDSISNISHTADALNQDINDLGISLEALANHLGFDPSKATHPENEQLTEEEDLLDMDEFLHTYGADSHSDYIDDSVNQEATITDIPSSNASRSPSPVVVTPDTAASTVHNKTK